MNKNRKVFRPAEPFNFMKDMLIGLAVTLFFSFFLLGSIGCTTMPKKKHTEQMQGIYAQIEDIKKHNSAFLMKLRLEGLQRVVYSYIHDF